MKISLINAENKFFVEYIYQVILNRSSDEDGLNYYIGRLIDPDDKVKIFLEIKNSEESINIKKDFFKILEIKKIEYNLRFMIFLEKIKKIFLIFSKTNYSEHDLHIDNYTRPPFLVERLYHEIHINDIDIDSIRNTYQEYKIFSAEDIISLIFSQCVYIKIFGDDKRNAEFYAKIGKAYIESNNLILGENYVDLSLFIYETKIALAAKAHLLVMRKGDFHLAENFYEKALKLGYSDSWFIGSYARTLNILNKFEHSIDLLIKSMFNSKDIDFLLKELDLSMLALWNFNQRKILSNEEILKFFYYINGVYEKVFNILNNGHRKFNKTCEKDIALIMTIENPAIIGKKYIYLFPDVIFVNDDNLDNIKNKINYISILYIENMPITLNLIKTIQYSITIGKRVRYFGKEVKTVSKLVLSEIFKDYLKDFLQVIYYLPKKDTKQKKKIAIVNTWYKPRLHGGAARVVADELYNLKKNYSNYFELVVYCANTHDGQENQVNIYVEDDLKIYEVCRPFTHITKWESNSPIMQHLFQEFLDYEKPDIIHFHCLQVLTASLCEAAIIKNIPYYVTIHDAWWISDYQFLLDDLDRLSFTPYLDDQYEVPSHTTLIESLNRKNYLRKILFNAKKVFPVSDSFSEIYDMNGIKNLVVNKNGISDDLAWELKDTTYTNNVVCAHIGGMSQHKGFAIFKESIKSLILNQINIEILLVDYNHTGDDFVVYWNSIKVRITRLCDFQDTPQLYKQIDVLFAPSICPESFGLVTREANACGCWVVASNLGAIGEDINTNNGFIIEPTVSNIQNVLYEINKKPLKFKQKCLVNKIRYTSEQTDELVKHWNCDLPR